MGGQALVLGKCSSWISVYHLLWSQMSFLCDSCGLRALQTLIQSQHYFNLLLCRWLIRNLICAFLYFSTRRVLSVILITKIPLFSLPYSPASSQTVSYFFLEDAQKKLPPLLQSLRKEKRWQLFFFSSKIKKEINYLQWFFKQNSILSSRFKSPKTA